jgi:hypothetical protein
MSVATSTFWIFRSGSAFVADQPQSKPAPDPAWVLASKPTPPSGFWGRIIYEVQNGKVVLATIEQSVRP